MKMTFKQTVAATALLAGSLLVTTLQAADTLTMSSWVPQSHYLYTDILLPWTKDVEKVTEGRVKVRILPKAMGSPPKHWELARKGVADITWGNFTYEPDRFKSIWFAEFPFSGDDAKAQSLALWNSYEKHLQADPAFSGVKMLTVAMFGALSLFGYSTERNLSTYIKYAIAAFAGYIVLAVIGMFVPSLSPFAGGVFGTVVLVIALAAIALITAWETQMLKRVYYGNAGNPAMESKLSAYGAASLLLAFINMFQILLSLFGRE